MPRLTYAALLVAAFLPGPLVAQPRPAQPGFYRIVVGDIEVTALNDGVVSYQTAVLFPTAGPERIAKSLAEAGLTDPWGMSYNAYLINTGSKLVLIDAGSGGKMADSPFFAGTGRVLANLRAAGYQPEQIDEIYITHFGPDHIGGLARGKDRVFPNAIVRAARNEVAGLETKDPRAAFWREQFQPYVDAGKLKPFDQDGPLAPGIAAVITAGHTPGHTSYLVESRGRKLLVLGDLILAAALQFSDPSLPTSFDADRAGGGAQRQRILELVAREDYLIAGSHLSFPGFGRVRTAAQGYRWVPADYAIPDQGH